MPGLDHTGPLGEGPRTGRGLGNCNPRPGDPDNPQPDASYGVGRGGRQRGGGRGRCFGGGRGRGFAEARTDDNAALREEVRELTDEVGRLRAELAQARQKKEG